MKQNTAGELLFKFLWRNFLGKVEHEELQHNQLSYVKITSPHVDIFFALTSMDFKSKAKTSADVFIVSGYLLSRQH